MYVSLVSKTPFLVELASLSYFFLTLIAIHQLLTINIISVTAGVIWKSDVRFWGLFIPVFSWYFMVGSRSYVKHSKESLYVVLQ